ncbi:MAG: ribbon-helix-helix domain-containing protein [Fimbriimonadaceae bacterium]
MKLKTSLTLSEDLVAKLDRLAGPKASRSSFIENILRDFVEGRAQAKRDAREVAAINRHTAKLNAEMKDALSFQSGVDEA